MNLDGEDNELLIYHILGKFLNISDSSYFLGRSGGIFTVIFFSASLVLLLSFAILLLCPPGDDLCKHGFLTGSERVGEAERLRETEALPEIFKLKFFFI